MRTTCLFLLFSIFLWVAVSPAASSSSTSNSATVLALSLTSVVSEGDALSRRLDIAVVRVRARLQFEEAIEDAERIFRARSKLSPLPTALPRAWVSGDIAVSIEEPAGAGALATSILEVVAREAAMRGNGIGSKSNGGQNSGGSEKSSDGSVTSDKSTFFPGAATPTAPPPAAAAAALLGLVIARARALPALRLNGLSVVEDYDGTLATWVDHVPLARFLETPVGEPVLGIPRGHRITSPTQRSHEYVKNTQNPLFLGKNDPLFLGTPWSSFLIPDINGAGGGKGSTSPPLPPPSISLWTSSLGRTNAALKGVPLFFEPNATFSLREIKRGVDVPRPLQSHTLDGSDYTPSSSNHFTTVNNNNHHFNPNSRGRQWWLLAPILNEPNAELARVAVAVRLLQVLGVVIAPVRWVTDIIRIGLPIITNAIITCAQQVQGRDPLPTTPVITTIATTTSTTTTVTSMPKSIIETIASFAHILPSEWSTFISAILDAVQHQFALYFAATERAIHVRWIANVIWGTGAELAATIVPPRDMSYHRAEVTALNKALKVIEAVRDAARVETEAARVKMA